VQVARPDPLSSLRQVERLLGPFDGQHGFLDGAGQPELPGGLRLELVQPLSLVGPAVWPGHPANLRGGPLGSWPTPRVLVIDEDQGHSAKAAAERSGFQRLLTEVTLDHVGLVLGLEMSRLARSNADWHHLIETCALFGTLLADQDGIYDAHDPNDRLLLGLKSSST
jgi:hypothetical protein